MSRIFVNRDHPLFNILSGQGIDCSPPEEASAETLKIGFINLMPTPIDPVRDFSKLFAKYADHDIHVVDFTPTPDFITTDVARHNYRKTHQLDLSKLAAENPDGLILTGFGKEDVPFESLKFWDEVTTALDIAEDRNIPVLASCWGSHAALYHHHGVGKTWDMTDKISGVFKQHVIERDHHLMQGVDASFTMPVSRYGRSSEDNIVHNSSLVILAGSPETGSAVVTDGRILYLTGHPEYPEEALANEYLRDKQAGVAHLRVPENVFVNDCPNSGIQPISWAENSGRLLGNWVQSVHGAKQDDVQRSAQILAVAAAPARNFG
ncbi:MAG TPA: homoserine O-succinyltransferase [Alphaproteobacteria bacterium]|nr:homoserine O-succinyltransferase [Alphaproteobacteria bacterium]